MTYADAIRTTQVLKQKGVYDPRRLFGVTTLDVVRARTFLSQAGKIDVNKFTVPVVGGHAGTTIVPLISQVRRASQFSLLYYRRYPSVRALLVQKYTC